MENIKNAIDMAKKYAALGDDEMAHIAEKKAWGMALAAIEAGAPNAQELAEEALKTQSIEFARWYA